MNHLRLCFSILAGILLSLMFVSSAHAATFTVTDTGDASAVDPNVSCDTAGNVCTLRSAIEAANAQAGADTINFNIAGSGVHTITPGTNLPSIIDQVIIDGTTQPGASTCTTNALVPANLPGANSPYALQIEINATNTTDATLVVVAANSVIRGLVLNNAPSNFASIVYANAHNGTIECNYIGTNASGTSAQTTVGSYGITAFANNLTIQNNLVSGFGLGGGSYGLELSGSAKNVQNNLIGTDVTGINAIPNRVGILIGDGSGQTNAGTINHNIISGNTAEGIQVGYLSYDGSNIVVVGNYIGLNVIAAALGNGGDGIYTISASNVVIGGSSAATRNVIAANSGNGIHIFSQGQVCFPSTDNTISGNYIGTNDIGKVAAGFGNQQSGIAVNEIPINCSHGSIYQNIIGGDSAGSPNVIAGNTLDGVRIYQVPIGDGATDVFSVSLLTNIIYGNGNLGINLAEDSTGTGTADTDLGPNVINNFLMSYPATNANYYINHPTINSTTYSGNQLTVNYNFQANGVQESPNSLLASNLVGYRLDFYLNDNAQDGAYAGYNQGKTHLGSFIVNGSETNATHTFTSPIPLSSNQSISTTTTVLWQNIPDCDGAQQGSGPPYNNCGPK